jgi:integrase/recombinase XerD
MSSLRKKMKNELELKGYSVNTQTAYIRCVSQFAQYFGKSPAYLGVPEIKEYLHHLIVKEKKSTSYINITYSALRFLYERILKQEWDLKEIPRTKQPKKLPVVLSISEVQELFRAIYNLKHKTILMTIYAAGLRVSEAAHLRVSDIDSKNMQIRIREAKGLKDRYTLLSLENLHILRMYWKQYKPKDWLFPGRNLDQPITTRSIQKMFEKAQHKAGIKKEASVHTLRHCFATHLLEAGTGVYHIQHLLGHTNPKTTNVYLHLTRKDILSIKSPLDLMEGMLHD